MKKKLLFLKFLMVVWALVNINCATHHYPVSSELRTVHFPVIQTARFVIRTDPKRLRTRWEACWLRDTEAYMAWFGPFGQLAAAVWLSPERVDWLTPGEHRHAWWSNNPAGWRAVVGFPIESHAVLKWLTGRWVPPLTSSKESVTVNGQRFNLNRGSLENFHYEIFRFPDGRIWRQNWHTPWDAEIRIDYRYGSAGALPTQMIWRWRSQLDNTGSTPIEQNQQSVQEIWMRWDGMKTISKMCRIPDIQRMLHSKRNWDLLPVERIFSGDHPLIVDLFLGEPRS